MATMSKVKAVAVKGKCHPKLHQPKDGVSYTGKSEIKWTFKGTYLAKNDCVVVVEAGISRRAAGCKVNAAATGGIFEAGMDGKFCEITLDESDLDRWALSVATKDETNEEMIFTAGTGVRGK